jgi:hypothetical protein
VLRGERLRSGCVHVHDVLEARAAAGGQVRGMDGPDATGTELCEMEHDVSCWRPLAGAVIKP